MSGGLWKINSQISMDRTAEFRQFLARECPRRARLALSRSKSQFTEIAAETRTRLHSAGNSLSALRSKIRASGSFDHEEWEINDLMRTLQIELSSVDQRIRDLDQFVKTAAASAKPPNAPFVLQTLRESLCSIGADFRFAVQERAERIEEYRRRRRHICARPREEPPDAVFHEEASAHKEEIVIAEANRERLDLVRSVESSVAQVAAMFEQLNEVIEAQHFDIVRIDQDAEAAISNVESGQRELVQYYEKIKGNKILILKIFAVLVVGAIVFVLII
jgi:ribosomal protein S15P/S13E